MDERIKEIEEYLNNQDYGPNITLNFTITRKMKETLLTRIKELEENRNYWARVCQEAQQKRDENAAFIAFIEPDLVQTKRRVKELEEGIKKVLQWRNLDGDGITDPLRMELYKLIGEEP